MNWKYCPQCNRKINDVAKKCPHCNYEIIEEYYPDFKFNTSSIPTKFIKKNGLSFECPEYYNIGEYPSRNEVYKSIVALSKNNRECEIYVMEYNLRSFDINAKRNPRLIRRYLAMQGYENILQNKLFPFCFDATINADMGKLKTTILYNFETYKVFTIVCNRHYYSDYNCLNDIKIINDSISSL